MTTFEKIHQNDILGKLTMIDRLIFKGHLRELHYGDNFRIFLWRQDVPIQDFSRYVQKATETLKDHAMKMAEKLGRPYRYLQSTHSRKTGNSKEDIAREIAERDGVTDGLICVLAAVEPCISFDLRRNQSGRRVLERRQRKCLHFYYYFMDREFGFMHVRLQSWFPMEIQIYVNGREWLCHQLDLKGIGYRRFNNCLLEIDDLDTAKQLCERFFRRKWPRLLNHFAKAVNPWLPTIQNTGLSGYYWVVDQAEVATDVMFRNVTELRRLMPDLLEHATLNMSAHDILRFAGKKRLCCEVTTDHKLRAEGRRVKHYHRRNSIKMYDKHSVLRVETTINNPREFKVLRFQETGKGRRSRRWMPMRKGVADFWRLNQVGSQANERYLDALANAQPRGKAIDELDGLCRRRVRNGKAWAKFNPVAASDRALFTAVLAGENAINGFRNRDLTQRLYNRKPRSMVESRRRCARTSRLIAKLRGHGLIAKVPRARLYRITPRGLRVMSAAVSFRNVYYPRAQQALAEGG